VTQLSTGKAWRIDPEPGFTMASSMYAFDGAWVYYGETVANASGVDRLHSLHRIRLDKLDTWAKRL
jgi:hypothetical protein